ncbi:gamma-glutamyltransferase [Pseudomarimonas salicorniae]|uniref:Glutathione hydrolase proenzyme n=1 Tax=Pseudomarimonas salicorniae TaxID=2933270 RepID=A0ABT0GL71_9GAMM|nr:gamma-glutamyltransferase [Lysobacter sp. CAU 1642]MCK7595283.1 gamma-glutamyltransferase [Lysobacter sp. CAU 1642]
MSVMVRFALLGVVWLAGVAGAGELPKQAVVASANAQATDAGLEVLAAGGNAFDAAVAVSATLGLVEPESSGLGGGGFFLLHLAKEDRQVFVDARERAPLAATRDMYLDADGKPQRVKAVDGALAAGIPGLPAGLVHLADKYGKLPLSRSLAPAIRLAKEGWVFGRKNASMMGWRRLSLSADPGASALFLVDGATPAEGTRMRNPDYARTLERLASEGRDGFYRGELAAKLVAGVRERGGIWSEQDLVDYRVVERKPLRLQHRGYRIVTAPPPSSGGIALAQTLQILEGLPYTEADSVQKLHWLTEALRRAYRDRAIYLGDPDFVEVPVEMLMSPHYAAGLRASIHPDRATPSAMLPGVGDSENGTDTTHFSIIDREGNLAAVTQTVNLPYGNAMVVPGTGFLLNNEMDDFSVKTGVPNAFGLVGDDANAIEPGKRPLSSMTPSFLIGPEKTAVLGTPGGSRIISMVLIGLMALMDGQTAQQAAAMPRVHHQYLPDVLSYEEGALDEATVGALRERGFTVEAGRNSWGNMHVARWNRITGEVDAGSDPRWGDVGKAATGVGEDEGSIFR